ncbi:MAG: alpha/beta fold hydrolase [Jiangellaceae bacterium]
MSREVQLSSGRVEYDDVGAGPVVVLIHGAHMNASVWGRVVDDLGSDYRCVVPTLPLGAHRLPMASDADLTPMGIAALLGELLDALDLNDVTLVGNDTGGALAQMLVTSAPRRIARLVLASCDAFDNFPPGLPGRVSALAGRMPGGMMMAAQAMRWGALARLPLTWGWMAKRPVPRALLDSWFEPLRTERAVRRDAGRFMRAVDRHELMAATEGLRSFDRPTLIAWASEDRVMPVDHAERLAELLRDARIVYVSDSYTLMPLDQPVQLAARIREFIMSTPAEVQPDVGVGAA